MDKGMQKYGGMAISRRYYFEYRHNLASVPKKP
jgi:hypothetical protein